MFNLCVKLCAYIFFLALICESVGRNLNQIALIANDGIMYVLIDTHVYLPNPSEENVLEWQKDKKVNLPLLVDRFRYDFSFINNTHTYVKAFFQYCSTSYIHGFASVGDYLSWTSRIIYILSAFSMILFLFVRFLTFTVIYALKK
jgi:hypothetical protein